MTQHILVIGRSGQLATSLVRANGAVTALGRQQIDLTNAISIVDRLRRLRPAAIINTAAFTAVDQAECDVEKAFALNRDAPGALARACEKLELPLIHLSTDYVFDGAKASPYVELDAKAPVNVYGVSKSEGEDAVLSSGARTAVVRTSWLFSSHGQNFLRTMLQLAKSRDEIGVVADQIGRPTWTGDLTLACLALAERQIAGDREAAGIFHFAGADDASWADFATAIFAEARIRGLPSARVRSILSTERSAPAQRPANSRLSSAKLAALIGVEPRPWRTALAHCMDEFAPRPSKR